MKHIFIDDCVERLKSRTVKEGGYSPFDNGSYRVDATAWVIIALTAAGIENPDIDKARQRLAFDQSQDGSVCISPSHVSAVWPTALASIAWHGSGAFREYELKAIKFLLETYGLTIPNDPVNQIGHDTTLRGWSWTIGTHSWIDPTANSIQALKLAGYGNNPRTEEGIRVILDRQLPDGGWNYGNTYVLGNLLRPMPDMTGIALAALSEMVDRSLIENSMEYLQDRLKGLKTPRSVSWAVLGLSSWGERPDQAEALIERCWEFQDRYGVYDSVLISQLVVAALLRRGLSDLSEDGMSRGAVNG